jgi:hypothetical protein
MYSSIDSRLAVEEVGANDEESSIDAIADAREYDAVEPISLALLHNNRISKVHRTHKGGGGESLVSSRTKASLFYRAQASLGCPKKPARDHPCMPLVRIGIFTLYARCSKFTAGEMTHDKRLLESNFREGAARQWFLERERAMSWSESYMKLCSSFCGLQITPFLAKDVQQVV